MTAAAAMARMALFGPDAERIGARCAYDTPVLFCDGTNVAEALAEATRRQRRGENFLVAPVVLDTLSVVSRLVAATVYEQGGTVDQFRYYFELLARVELEFNGKPVSQHEIYPVQVIQAMREFSQMGQGLYVRSIAEQLRLETLFGRKRSHVAVAPLIDLSVPDVRPGRDARNIVVWAPDVDAYQLGTYAYALSHIKWPLIFVCRGRLANSPHSFVAPERGAAALRQAALVVDTQMCDPGTAMAFAHRGYAVAFADTSGAGEYLQSAAGYKMHDFSSISSAVTRARGDRRSFIKLELDANEAIAQALTAAQPCIPNDPPLVSIVIPTYNRRNELRMNLESFLLQTYENFEVVVVNDCGEDVGDVVAQFPFARYLCMPKNGGCTAAANFGLRAARGEYVGVLADDDRYYPNHLSTMVSALTISGLDVAHSNVLLRHETRSANGEFETFGYRLDHDGHLDCFQVYWADTHMSPVTCVVRRERFEQIGFLDVNLKATGDIDWIIKLSKLTDFVHVNFVTGEMGHRDDHSSLASGFGDGLATELHQVLRSHAPPDSVIIASRIDMLCESIAIAARAGVTHDSPWLRLAKPLARDEL